MTPTLFSELGLSEEVRKAIDKLGFEKAAPIQAAAIPVLMAGRDVVGQSQTGSGKTAAFAIPAIEKTDPKLRAVQVLILCPTRELAVQVSEEVHKLASFKHGINALPIYGGQSYERQFDGLRRGAQIVIGTPGRVMDHMRRGTLRLETVKMVILDEVDVMLNMGFRDDIELILQATPKERQTVFFSATIPRPIQQLIEKYSRDPQQVRIEQKAMTVPTVEQVYYEVDRRYKMELLTRLIDLHDLKLGIIFCNTKRMVDDLVDHLEAAGYMADRLHGDMTQAMRDRVMNKFRKSGLEFLVATDIAARGIDVDDIEVVFNYDLPYDGEDYVHRIGRTGRVGRKGRAITFVSGRELFQIRNIERYTNTRIQRARIPTEAEVGEARENVFLGKLRATLQSGEYQKQDQLIERLLEEGFNSTDLASALIHLLKSGGETSARAPRTEKYERPDRPERPHRESFRDGPRQRQDDRRAPRYESRERFERPQRFADRREERPARATGAPISRSARPEKPLGPAAPASSPARPTKIEPAPLAVEGRARHSVRADVPTPASGAHGVTRPTCDSQPEAKLPAETKPEVQKTYSDAEILASVKPEFRKPVESKPRHKSAPPWEKRERVEEKPAFIRPPKKDRPPAGHYTRLHMNLGEEMGVAPIDIVNTIAGETGLPGKVVGKVDVRERHLFVDVATDHANAILAKLNRANIKGHKVKVKAA
ncbi:MAG: DEAD/DEAH box helicase [Verrucomicrobia bacterium]|jgi:ATP-dependent RNA helicase DeaD|nr:DEAD/DEAH box helicase [Verrucomicrobiota bacterium]